MDPATATLLFDDGSGDLGPLSDLRASFEQRAGGFTMLERVRATGARIHAAVGGALQPVLRERHGDAAFAVPAAALCVNGRLHAALDAALRSRLAALGEGRALVAADGSVVAARLAGRELSEFAAGIAAGRTAVPSGVAVEPCDLALWTRPWHLLDAERLGAALAADMAAAVAGWGAGGRGTLPAHAHCTAPASLHLHATATVGIGVVFDTAAGPVFVDQGAQVGHGSVITGPAWIGARSIVAERTVLKARAVIGPQCRAAGEIGSAIFQGFSNKAHDGHLGDALLGEWVNLGAGTVNSNLLNTYGEVAMRLRPSGALERSGRQFMGCIVGDHAKTAIGTRIMTGSSVGTGAMWAAGAAISGAVAPFAWVTDDGERRFRLDKFADIARTVMARRGTVPGTAYLERLSALHAAGQG